MGTSLEVALFHLLNKRLFYHVDWEKVIQELSPQPPFHGPLPCTALTRVNRLTWFVVWMRVKFSEERARGPAKMTRLCCVTAFKARGHSTEDSNVHILGRRDKLLKRRVKKAIFASVQERRTMTPIYHLQVSPEVPLITSTSLTPQTRWADDSQH